MAPPSFPYGNRFRVRRFHAAPSPLRKPKNKNCSPNCNFFAIRDCCVAPDRGSKRKSAGNQPQNEPFPLFGDGKESLIEKKLQRNRDFVSTLGESPQRGGSCGKHVKPQRRKRLAKNARVSGETNYAKNARDPAPTMGLGPVKERYKQGYLFTYSRM